jgi:hypothetical protein
MLTGLNNQNKGERKMNIDDLINTHVEAIDCGSSCGVETIKGRLIKVEGIYKIVSNEDYWEFYEYSILEIREGNILFIK